MKMKPRTSFGFVAVFMAFVLIATIKIQHEHLKIDMRASQLKGEPQERWRRGLEGLPRGIVSETSDLELKSLWQKSRSTKEDSSSCNALLAMAVGIAQKKNVDRIVSKFVAENCSAILFHYDGNVDGWRDLSWNNKAIHIVAENQTKWWFAKRFLHPDVVSTYDHIFLWDEDLGVDNFNPKRYLEIMLSEGLEISQPALDPNKSTDIHHRITVRNSRRIVHRRVYSKHGSLNCSSQSTGPPCTGCDFVHWILGTEPASLTHRLSLTWPVLTCLVRKIFPRWVEGMAPVFSQAAWRCVWHLIQNDLIHGWGLDMKLGYCAQGDRTKKVGVIDKEFVVHQGIPTLGGPSPNKPPRRSLDMRTKVRRQSTAELAKFKERWNKAVEEDKRWRDPFQDTSRRRRDETSRRNRDET